MILQSLQQGDHVESNPGPFGGRISNSESKYTNDTGE